MHPQSILFALFGLLSTSALAASTSTNCNNGVCITTTCDGGVCTTYNAATGETVVVDSTPQYDALVLQGETPTPTIEEATDGVVSGGMEGEVGNLEVMPSIVPDETGVVGGGVVGEPVVGEV